MVLQAVQENDRGPPAHGPKPAIRVRPSPFLQLDLWLMLDFLNRIKVKQMQLAYGIEKVFNEDIPNLQHGNDGLIYTCLHTPYVAGTDQNMYVAVFFIYKHQF